MVVLTVLPLLFRLYDCFKVYACNIFSPHNPKDVHLQVYLVKDIPHHHPPLPVHWHHHHPTGHSHHETQGCLMTVTPCWFKCIYITLKAMCVLYKKPVMENHYFIHRRFKKYQQFLLQLFQQQEGITFGTETHKPFNILLKVPYVAVHQLHLHCHQGKMAADLHQGSTKGCFFFMVGGYEKCKNSHVNVLFHWSAHE